MFWIVTLPEDTTGDEYDENLKVSLYGSLFGLLIDKLLEKK
jgi:hypothetical protein